MAHTTINNYTTFEFKDKDRFVGKDFEMWSTRIKAILLDRELWTYVSGGNLKPVPADPAAPTNAERQLAERWEKEDRKARNVLMQGLGTETMHLYSVQIHQRRRGTKFKTHMLQKTHSPWS